MFISPLWPIQDRATRADVGLLGPCFKTGQMDDRPTYSGLSLANILNILVSEQSTISTTRAEKSLLPLPCSIYSPTNWITHNSEKFNSSVKPHYKLLSVSKISRTLLQTRAALCRSVCLRSQSSIVNVKNASLDSQKPKYTFDWRCSSSLTCLEMWISHSTGLRGSICFPANGFTSCWTLSSKFFATFPHGTCLLSVSQWYLALGGAYHLL